MATALLSLSRLAAPAEPSDGTPITEARQTLEHWSRRGAQLRWYHRAGRREARRMMATARAQLIGAHLERWGLATVARVLTPLLDTGGLSAGAHIRSLTWSSMRRTPLGRRILRGAAGIAAACITCFALVAALVTHLLGLWAL